MKKQILFTLAFSAAMLFTGCDETWDTGGSGEGGFNPVVTLTTTPDNSTSQKAPSRSNAKEIGVDDLAMKLTSTATSAVQSWNSVSEFDINKKFNVGSYTLEVSYGNPDDEGYDMPAYYGSTQFSVRENEITPVAVAAKLANTMLSITYTEAFTNYFTGYSINVISSTGKKIAWDDALGSPLYFAPGQTRIEAEVIKPNGVKATYQAVAFAAEACHHYHLTLNVNDGNVGKAELVISFDDEMDIEDVIIDLSNDVQNTPEPEIAAEGVAAGEPLTIVTGTIAPLQYKLIAHGGIASAILSTTSPSLVEQGWPAQIDLMAASDAQKTAMTAFGFNEVGLWKNPDRMAVVDLSEVISHIRYFVSSANLSTFSLTLTDRLGRSTEPLEVQVVVENYQVELSEPGVLFEGGTELELTMNFNGANPGDVKFYAHNNRLGTDDLVSSEVISTTSRAMNAYRVKLSSLPANTETLSLTAKVNDSEVETSINVERVPADFALSVSDNDAFATYASLQVVGQNNVSAEKLAEMASQAVLYMSTNGGSSYSRYETTLSSLYLKAASLNPETQYTAYIEVSGVHSNTVTFTTEAAPQLPNSDMEQWNSKGHTHYTEYYPWANGGEQAWNTYNPVTTSQSGAGYAYVITSGTIQTADSHSGSSAAQIRTVGWGSGNKASSSTGNWQFGGTIFGKWECKHISAGQLFLGNWDNVSAVQDATPNYGIEFQSRPSSMSFWYKYAQMSRNGNENNQKGVAEIHILDAAGNVVSEQVAYLEKNATYSNLDDASDSSVGGQYAPFTVSLDYPANSAKAAKIQVIFRSTQFTTSELEAAKNENNIRPPKGMNLSNHENLGSSLFIDDITLNY